MNTEEVHEIQSSLASYKTRVTVLHDRAQAINHGLLDWCGAVADYIGHDPEDPALRDALGCSDQVENVVTSLRATLDHIEALSAQVAGTEVDYRKLLADRNEHQAVDSTDPSWTWASVAAEVPKLEDLAEAEDRRAEDDQRTLEKYASARAPLADPAAEPATEAATSGDTSRVSTAALFADAADELIVDAEATQLCAHRWLDDARSVFGEQDASYERAAEATDNIDYTVSRLRSVSHEFRRFDNPTADDATSAGVDELDDTQAEDAVTEVEATGPDVGNPNRAWLAEDAAAMSVDLDDLGHAVSSLRDDATDWRHTATATHDAHGDVHRLEHAHAAANDLDEAVAATEVSTRQLAELADILDESSSEGPSARQVVAHMEQLADDLASGGEPDSAWSVAAGAIRGRLAGCDTQSTRAVEQDVPEIMPGQEALPFDQAATTRASESVAAAEDGLREIRQQVLLSGRAQVDIAEVDGPPQYVVDAMRAREQQETPERDAEPPY